MPLGPSGLRDGLAQRLVGQGWSLRPLFVAQPPFGARMMAGACYSVHSTMMREEKTAASAGESQMTESHLP